MGEKIALVGQSGCGKSTVLKLITRLLIPQSGTITVLGTPIQQWDVEALRKQMSVLQQKPFVFQGTIADNVRLGMESADDMALQQAADNAMLSGWIAKQADGWQSETGEHGALLSGGLRQRVELARLFLKDAPIELLDEATSALDAKNQKEIMACLRSHSEGKTRIMIAHRLATVTDADRILFLHNGTIVEEGTHEQLLAKRSYYYHLYTAQEAEDADGE